MLLEQIVPAIRNLFPNDDDHAHAYDFEMELQRILD